MVKDNLLASASLKLEPAPTLHQAAYKQGYDEAAAAYQPIHDQIMARTDISRGEKLRLIRKRIKELRRAKGWLDAESDSIESQLDLLKRKRDAVDDLAQFIKANPKLQQATASSLHHLESASLAHHVVELGAVEHDLSAFDLERLRDAVFLVQHDWSAAMASSDLGGEWKLPFDHCCFEFRLSGRPVIVIADCLESLDITLFVCVKTGEFWCAALYKWNGIQGLRLHQDEKSDESVETLDDNEPSFVARLFDQIRAISIALDAEVVVTEQVRAPHRLNSERMKVGKLPLYSYHVVKLPQRSRAVALPSGSEHGTHRSPRLHFRRGHWRHYETFKTWVRWTLVGNPDLGFIDKEYRL